jgi:hypothetical protein
MRFCRKRGRAEEMVTASEIAAFVFCPESWRLQYGVGLKPANQAALESGDRHHAGKAMAERVAGGFIGIGRLVAVLAVLVLILLWVFAR